ncbi:hypothetical protein E4U09_002906 [Claviceps aff. purpurea]|uniref:Uncharacterized protein n=1 Tax=Claviceps aff. purpurea TaxID=1967640 RepID=A0A9P7QFC3_9HYPO|nr:hypothetical protein E4U09_002906 [Claviceps aff. purpurea]
MPAASGPSHRTLREPRGLRFTVSRLSIRSRNPRLPLPLSSFGPASHRMTQIARRLVQSLPAGRIDLDEPPQQADPAQVAALIGSKIQCSTADTQKGPEVQNR